MSGIKKLESDMVAAHVTPHEVLDMKQTINKILDKIENLEEEVYRLGPNAK